MTKNQPFLRFIKYIKTRRNGKEVRKEEAMKKKIAGGENTKLSEC